MTGNLIGGATAASRNLISGNEGYGVAIIAGSGGASAAGNTVRGNWIGLDSTGDGLLANGSSTTGMPGGLPQASGVYLNSSSASLIANVVAGHQVEVNILRGGSHVIQGNFTGLNAAGDTFLGGGHIQISGASNNLIGGGMAGQGNVIARGVLVFADDDDTADGNKIQGNKIGTDVSGTVAIGNSGYGVRLMSQGSVNVSVRNNIVGADSDGTADAAEGNLISGNAQSGIEIIGAFASNNVVAGNLIGTDVTGTADLGNTGNGITINGAPNNTIGGATAAARNVISGNNSDGVSITGAGATGNLVAGNLIGTDSAGTAALANTGDGVQIANGAAGNTIGGTAAGARNVISGNATDGVNITDVGLPSGIVSWWRAENNATDFVDGNHGTLQLGASFDNGMNYGTAFYLHGIDAHVQVPNAANLNPASALTLDAWIFPTDTFGTIISKYDASGGQQVSYLLELNSAALALPFTVRGMLVEAS